MKVLLSFLSVIAAVAASQTASAQTVITSVDVSNGTTTSTFDNMTAGQTATSGDAVNLLSLTAGGVTYNSLVAPDSFTGTPSSTFVAIGSPQPSGSDATLETDGNLVTGSLNTFTNGGIYDFSTQTIADDTLFFSFFNDTNGAATEPNIQLVDSTGAAITTALPVGSGGTLFNAQIFRSGNSTQFRNFSGTTFSVGDFAFLTGSTSADVTGFLASNTSADFVEVGIASISTTAVPEPSSAIILLGGLGAIIARRRRK